MKKGTVLFFLLTSIVLNSQYIDMEFTDPFKNLKSSINTATCITQDTLGQIWIGTTENLNCYNGYDNKSYKHNYQDTKSILANRISTLYTDKKGRIWIGFLNGICIYNPLFDNFDRVADINTPNGIKSLEIIQFIENNNDIYVCTSMEIYRYNEETNQFNTIFTISKGEISEIVFDKLNNIWIGAIKDGGLIYLDTKDSKTTHYYKEDGNKNSLSDNSILSLKLIKNELWIATSQGGINNYNIKTNQFKNYFTNSEYEKYARYIYIDNKQNIWSIDVTGLKIYDPKADNFSGYYPTDKPNSIKPIIIEIFQDSQNNYWTLHDGEGVGLRTVPKGFNFFENSREKYWHLTFDYVSTITEDNLGNLWIGNPSNGINIFNWETRKIESYTSDPNNKYSLGLGATHVIFRDSKEQMWVGTHMGGLQKFNAKTKTFISYTHDDNNPYSIANNDIRSISEDKNGDLWIVTHGNGVDRFNEKENKFYNYNQNNSQLSNDYAFQILVDKNDNVWVATVWGLSLLNKKTQSFHFFYNMPNIPNTLSSSRINCLYEDMDGSIWVGTENGLNLFNPIDSTFTRYGDNFLNKNIGSIIKDDSNRIWMGTSSGISVFDTKTNLYYLFDKSDGLLSNEINQRSVFKNSGNQIYFGTNKGIVYFNPDKLFFNKTPPKSTLTKFKVFNQEITHKNSPNVLNSNITYASSINLTHEQKVITFEYAAINYINPSKNKFKYKMEGFDKDWIFADVKREVTYTNLDPGTYTFKVISCNNDDVWDKNGTSVKLIISPPWWETIAFRIISIMLIIVVVIIIYSFRTANLRKQKGILESLVGKRTVELNEKNKLLEKQTDNLNDTNTLLEERQQQILEQSEILKKQTAKLSKSNADLEQSNSTKNKLFSIIAHDLKDPFNTILGFADFLMDEFDSIEETEKKKMIEAIHSSSNRVHSLLHNLLKWARSQTGSIQLNKKNINVYKLVQNSYYVLKDSLNAKEIEIVFNIPEEIDIYADENTTQTILRNLINNAIKFTPKKGIINISATKKMNIVKICVSDTGIGMTQDTIDNLFIIEKNKTVKGTEGEKGSGLGLLLCKEFTELNQGNLEVESTIGKGSTFCIALPSLIE